MKKEFRIISKKALEMIKGTYYEEIKLISIEAKNARKKLDVIYEEKYDPEKTDLSALMTEAVRLFEIADRK